MPDRGLNRRDARDAKSLPPPPGRGAMFVPLLAALAAVSVIGSVVFVVWVNVAAVAAEQMKRDYEAAVAPTFVAVHRAELSQRFLEHQLGCAVARRDRAVAAAERVREAERTAPPEHGTGTAGGDS